MAEAARETWRKRVERWRDSGLTAGEFAAETGLNERTLRWWSSRLSRSAQPKGRVAARPRRAPKFVEVTHALGVGDGVALEVAVDGVVVRVPPGFDEETLRRVLAVVRAP